MPFIEAGACLRICLIFMGLNPAYNPTKLLKTVFVTEPPKQAQEGGRKRRRESGRLASSQIVDFAEGCGGVWVLTLGILSCVLYVSAP